MEIGGITMNSVARANDAAFSSKQALVELLRGNERFLSDQCTHHLNNVGRRKRTVSGQSPLAAILTCSDSRVAPEIILDQGIGSIFVVRTAGNVLDNVALGSIEYAVEHLHVPLVMVLGHQRCGAVSAAVQGGQVSGRIAQIFKEIEPAIERTRGLVGDPITNAVDANILAVVSKLRSCKSILAE
jgi:carbonic anhydrase